MKLQTTNTVAKFKCLQGDCPDTCCKGWSMQVDDLTFEKYKGTDLENAIGYDGVNQEIRVMKRDPQTDYCVKFTDGICAIHAAKGSEMLGDACNLYPRITRKTGDETIMTATLSCPEIVRLSLVDADFASFVAGSAERIPLSIIDYKDTELTPSQMLKIHESFLQATQDAAPAERIMAHIYSASRSLHHIVRKDWDGAASFMLKMADGKLPASEKLDTDQYYLLQVFAAIFHATKKKMNPRLEQSINYVESHLGIKINWETLNLDKGTAASGNKMSPSQLDSILKRYLAAQLSFMTFPFAGLCEDITEKARLLAFKFALTRLFLSSITDATEDKIITSIQSVARIIDHLGSPELLFSLMNQFGWNTEPRLRGLVGDN